MDYLEYIFGGMTVSQKNGINFTWKAFLTLVFVSFVSICYKYNDNIERHNVLLEEAIKDIHELKQDRAVAAEYKQTDIFQHQQLFSRIDKVERTAENNSQDIAELFGFTGLKK